jgi:hypothetical protein
LVRLDRVLDRDEDAFAPAVPLVVVFAFDVAVVFAFDAAFVFA